MLDTVDGDGVAEAAAQQAAERPILDNDKRAILLACNMNFSAWSAQLGQLEKEMLSRGMTYLDPLIMACSGLRAQIAAGRIEIEQELGK